MNEAPQFDLLASHKVSDQPLSTSRTTTPVPPAPARPEAAREPRRWDADDPDVVIQAQPRTGVWTNPFGAIVICQEAAEYGDDDPFVMIRPENIDALIRGLLRERDGRG